MTLSLAQDAIALLIDLAERGEVDPWDVKVIEVIDRFLSELAPKVTESREGYEASLSKSGQAFLYASMLVLLKADSLTQAETQVAEAGEADLPDFLPDEEAGSSPLPLNLERQLRRRAVAPAPQRRRVTLKELIEQLQVIAAALEETGPRPRPARARPQPRSQAIRAIAQLAHQENLSEMALALEQMLADSWPEATQGGSWLDFDLLLELWCQTKAHQFHPVSDHPPSLNHDRVGVFWALLLLASQSKVELAQDEFYRDLKVRALTEADLQQFEQQYRTDSV